MCCGSKRRAWINTSTPARAASATSPVSQSTSNRTHIPATPGLNPATTTASRSGVRTSLPPTPQHLETSTMRVRGPVTGRWYDFSGARPPQAMDPRDGAVLMRSGLFRRV